MTARKRNRRALTRSEVMSRIRRKDTSPELFLRRALRELGLRYRVDLRVEGVHVDVAFPAKRAVVFVDGCFWHCCPKHGTKPRSNTSYWLPKLRRNRMRDRRQSMALRRAGWHVLRFWEHECVSDPNRAAFIVRDALATYAPERR